jgi:hypothetical protein
MGQHLLKPILDEAKSPGDEGGQMSGLVADQHVSIDEDEKAQMRWADDGGANPDVFF